MKQKIKCTKKLGKHLLKRLNCLIELLLYLNFNNYIHLYQWYPVKYYYPTFLFDAGANPLG